MTYLPLLILLAVALLSVLFFIPARPAFRVRIEGGTARVVKGRGLDDLLQACREAAREAPEVSGEVFGMRHDGTLNLHFSRSIPDATRQRVAAACAAASRPND